MTMIAGCGFPTCREAYARLEDQADPHILEMQGGGGAAASQSHGHSHSHSHSHSHGHGHGSSFGMAMDVTPDRAEPVSGSCGCIHGVKVRGKLFTAPHPHHNAILCSRALSHPTRNPHPFTPALLPLHAIPTLSHLHYFRCNNTI